MRIRDLIVLALACRWATVLVTTSYLFEPFRAAAQRAHPKLGYLTRCPMCAGTWLGIGLVALLTTRNPLATAFIRGLAVKGLASTIDIYLSTRTPLP